ncbi:MAG: 16S rRNA (guanine(966)-N(2))-methyltransferase RsmD [bacterium]|nr:16S rRNA (guanine(966)-N(2))-methyltransferase RsmD [bacterium]
MQILFGQHKGRRLKTPPDERIRPTTGRMRDWLGNVLRDHFPESMVLDLFAGCGGLGLLALSMGARQVTFVDRAPLAVRLIEHNLRHLGEESTGVVLRLEVGSFLRRRPTQRWDVIFVDPPYDETDYPRLMTALGQADILTNKGLLVVEHPSQLKPAAEGLILLRAKAFGRSTISLFQQRREPGDGSADPHRPD